MYVETKSVALHKGFCSSYADKQINKQKTNKQANMNNDKWIPRAL